MLFVDYNHYGDGNVIYDHDMLNRQVEKLVISLQTMWFYRRGRDAIWLNPKNNWW